MLWSSNFSGDTDDGAWEQRGGGGDEEGGGGDEGSNQERAGQLVKKVRVND